MDAMLGGASGGSSGDSSLVKDSRDSDYLAELCGAAGHVAEAAQKVQQPTQSPTPDSFWCTAVY